MTWLLVGIQHNEIDFFPYGQYYNIDFHDADHKADAFKEDTWINILQTYGSEYFDVILTDGGLMNVKRKDKIIIIKNMLLKPGGYILNYTSIIGEKVEDPLGRPGINFFKIPKQDYTIQKHDKAWSNKTVKTWGDNLKTRIKLII
tara:strand:- start:120 stop:554 length:435 start_codon:yes stop_codon:yes gene_type:complete